MIEVNVYEAKTQLSRLLQRVEAGEEIVIARRGRPIARLIPESRARGQRELGYEDGMYEVGDVLPPSSVEDESAWYERPIEPSDPP